MTGPAEPEDRGEQWSAYEPTQHATPNPYAPNPYQQDPYQQDPRQQDPYSQAAPPPVPYSIAPYPGAAYPAHPASPQSVFAAQGPAPATGQSSSIGAMVVGGILLVTCFATPAGLAPLVLGILGFTKANSVNRLWMAGQRQEAEAAADSSRTLALWAWISCAVGIAVMILAVVFFFVWALNVDPNTSNQPGTYGT